MIGKQPLDPRLAKISASILRGLTDFASELTGAEGKTPLAQPPNAAATVATPNPAPALSQGEPGPAAAPILRGGSPRSPELAGSRGLPAPGSATGETLSATGLAPTPPTQRQQQGMSQFLDEFNSRGTAGNALQAGLGRLLKGDIQGAIGDAGTAYARGRPYTEFAEALESSPELYDYYRQQTGAEGDVPREEVASEAVTSHIDSTIGAAQRLAETDPQKATDLLAKATGQIMRMGADDSPYRQQVAEGLQRIAPIVREVGKDWNEEQRLEYANKVGEALLPSAVQRQHAMAQAAAEEGVDLQTASPDQRSQLMKGFIERQLQPGADAAAAEYQRALDKGIAENPQESGFSDWLTSNWKNFLVPAGALAFMFGGNTGRLLGALAMGYGGYDLYDRYKNLADPSSTSGKLVQSAVTDLLEYTDPQTGEPAPLSPQGVNQIARQYSQQYGEAAGQDVRQGLRDFGFLARYGFRDQLAQGIQNAAHNTVRQLVGEQPQQAPLPYVGEVGNLLQQGRDVASSVWDRARNTLSGGGQ